MDWLNGIKVLDLMDATEAKSFKAGGSQICTAQGLKPSILLRYAAKDQMRHIVQTDGIHPESETITAAIMLKEPTRFLDFPLSAILKPAECGPETEHTLRRANFEFSGSNDRSEMVDSVLALAEKCSRSATFLHHIRSSVDELIENVVLNAPHGDLAPMRTGAEDEADQDDRKTGILFAGSDQDRFVIGCTDVFGSVDMRELMGTMLEYAVNGPPRTTQRVEQNVALCCYLTFNNAASFYAGTHFVFRLQFTAEKKKRSARIYTIYKFKAPSRPRPKMFWPSSPNNSAGSLAFARAFDRSCAKEIHKPPLCVFLFQLRRKSSNKH